MSKKFEKVMTVWSNEEVTGETTFFLDGDKVVGSVDGNDGQWRGEYFDGIIGHFGVGVEYPKKLTKKQETAYLAYAKEYGLIQYED